MNSGGGGGGMALPPQALSAEALFRLKEGITLVLSRWTALQMAVENQWGGSDSCVKSENLASTILSWFAHTQGEHYIDDLENMLYEDMRMSFHTEIGDGSVEEVAEQLMIMHVDCLKGHFESIDKLRQLGPGRNAVSQSIRVTDDDEEDESSDEEMTDDDEEESSDEEVSDMMVDEPQPKEMAVEKPNSEEIPDEEGWSVVARRRNRGRRCG